MDTRIKSSSQAELAIVYKEDWYAVKLRLDKDAIALTIDFIQSII